MSASPRRAARPDGVITTLSASIDQALNDPGIKKRIADLGDTTLATSPAEFSKLVLDEIDKWRKVIRTANIKAE